MNPLTDIATREPESFTQGETVTWKRTDLAGDYPVAAYTLAYLFNSRSPSGSFTVNASVSGANFLVSFGASPTTTYVASDRVRGQSGYVWEAYMTRTSDGAKVRIANGTLDIIASLLAQSAGYDARSHVKKVLDAIEALLEGSAVSSDVQEYEIHGRKVVRMPKADLLKFRSQYRAEYLAELDAEKIRRGLGTGRKVLTRFL